MVADQDAYFDAEVSIFKLHDGTSLRTMTPYVKELRGLPGQYKVSDVTPFGAAGERPGLGIVIAHFSVEWLLNMVTDVGSATVLTIIWNAKAAVAF